MNSSGPNEAPPAADAAHRSAGFGVAVVVVMIASAVALQAFFASSDRPSAKETPEETVEVWLEAQEAGNLESLELLSAGELQKEIARRRREQSDDVLARDLQQELQGLKGHVLSDKEEAGDGVVRLKLKLIFADEEQTAHLELVRRDGLWYLSRRQFADRKESAIPYGTPVAPSDTIEDQ